VSEASAKPQVATDEPATRSVGFWRAETGFFLGLLLIFLFVGQTRFFRDPGTFWHTVAGERMLASGRLIETDSFSFTYAARPWIAQQWLSECLMALFYRAAQRDGLLLATATILACAYTWVAHRLLSAGLHWSLTIFVVMLVVVASAYHFHARPHLVTILLLGWTFGRLADFEDGRLRLPQLFWLVPLFIIWTNLHGGMLGGLFTMGLAVAGWTILYWLGRESPVQSNRQALLLIALTLACALTALANPYGLRMTRVWIYLSGPSVLPQYILEHMPLNPGEFGGQCVLLVGLVYLVTLLGICRYPRVTWLIPMVWFYLACKSIRHGPLFTVLAGLALADIFPHTRWARWLAQAGTYLYRPQSETPVAAVCWPNWRPAVIPAAVVLAALVLQMGRVPVPLLGHGWAQLDPTYWPVELEQELRALPGGTPIFNDMLFGGFLIQEAPNLRVFIDDRCELYRNDFIAEYFEAERHHPEQIEVWADRYHFEWALVAPSLDAGFDGYLSQAQGWTTVKRTDAAVLYRRKRDLPSPDLMARGPHREQRPKRMLRGLRRPDQVGSPASDAHAPPRNST
jgi:hypothetical protein